MNKIWPAVQMLARHTYIHRSYLDSLYKTMYRHIFHCLLSSVMWCSQNCINFPMWTWWIIMVDFAEHCLWSSFVLLPHISNSSHTTTDDSYMPFPVTGSDMTVVCVTSSADWNLHPFKRALILRSKQLSARFGFGEWGGCSTRIPFLVWWAGALLCRFIQLSDS